MRHSFLFFLLMVLTITMVSSCKEKETNDQNIITKMVPKPAPPKGTQQLSSFEYKRVVEWIGSSYTIRIKRFADKTLPTTTDEDGKKYYDNKITLEILRKDGTTFFHHTFSKSDFSAFTNNTYGKNGILIGFMYDKVEGNTIKFGASVGSPNPNSDEYVPIDVVINNMGEIAISNSSALDLNREEINPKKTETELAEEDGM